MSAALFSNPYKGDYDFTEQKALHMFWKKSADSVQECFELTEPMRSTDPWLLAQLDANRHGRETWEVYCFVHGLPTRNVGSWLPTTGHPTCGNARCTEFATTQWAEMLRRKCPWDLRQQLECDICTAERTRHEPCEHC